MNDKRRPKKRIAKAQTKGLKSCRKFHTKRGGERERDTEIEIERERVLQTIKQ